MKKILSLTIMLIVVSANAQIAIGKDKVTNNSVSLEFGSAKRGFVLPWVTSASSVTNAVNGSLIFDSADKKVKYRKDGSWFDFTNDNNGVVNTSAQNNLVEKTDAKVAVGRNSAGDKTPGILVLTDPDKAMVLPKVPSPHLNIVNPSAGMMVYDTDSHQLATFNGTVWSFWKGI